jgi:hypothetical protein
MTDPVPTNDTRLADFAGRFDFSEDAVRHLLYAVSSGGGDMAMFDHPEFAGPGQWMRGGLIMITDSSNHVLRHRIDALCNALSDALREPQSADYRRLTPSASEWDVVSVTPERWWPPELGEPSATGSQIDIAYAYFDQARRLAMRRSGQVLVYDTGEHRITGIAQSQQYEHSEIRFTSQLGDVSLDALERIATSMAHGPMQPVDSETPAEIPCSGSDDILEAIERLGELHRKGVLTEAEFTGKKRELLSRL